jgi:hypothetical protein
LYDSDAPPDYFLNTYHIHSQPRILLIQEPDADNKKVTQVDVPCLIKGDSKNDKKLELKNLELSYHDKKKFELQ